MCFTLCLVMWFDWLHCIYDRSMCVINGTRDTGQSRLCNLMGLRQQLYWFPSSFK
jgi:hypothetical protein